MVNPLRYVAFMVTFVGHCTVLQLIQYLPFFTVRPFSIETFRKFNRFVMDSWVSTIVWVTSIFAPTKLVVSGYDEPIDGNVVLIANHQTFADWWYLWIWAYNQRKEGALRIILKYSLKHIPVYGWGMQMLEFIFLRRNWEKDKKMVQRTLATYKHKSHHPFWLVIFPEGTIIREVSKAKAQAYAEKNGLKSLQHMLLPRTTGLMFCVDSLRDTTSHLIDVTIGYKGTMPGQIPSKLYNLKSIFLDGRGPPEVHMHVRKIPLKDVPRDEKAFVDWTMKLYAEKDELLERFFQTGSFSPVRQTQAVQLRSATEILLPYVVAAVQLLIYYILWSSLRAVVGPYWPW